MLREVTKSIPDTYEKVGTCSEARVGGAIRYHPSMVQIWASKGFRHGFERIKPRRHATALWGKQK